METQDYDHSKRPLYEEMYFLRACSGFDFTVRVAKFPHPTPLWALGTTATDSETILLWAADFGRGNAPTLGQHGNLGNPNPLGFKIHPEG